MKKYIANKEEEDMVNMMRKRIESATYMMNKISYKEFGGMTFTQYLKSTQPEKKFYLSRRFPFVKYGYRDKYIKT